MVVDIRRLTVAEYHRMGELGIVDPDEHIELIEGQIIKKPVKGTSHSAATKRIEKLLENLLAEQVLYLAPEELLKASSINDQIF